MKSIAVRLWLPAAIVAIWQIAASARLLDPLFFLSPARLTVALWELISTGVLASHLAHTLIRLGVAYGVGCSLGIVLGLALGITPFWRRSTQAIFHGLYAMPKLALLPAFLVFFGLNDTSRMLPAGLTCFVLLAASCMDAAQDVKPGYSDMARSYGAGRRALFLRVYLPASLPRVFTGLRLGLGSGLIMVVGCEMLGATTGMGALIWLSGQTLSLDRMYVGIILCSILGTGANYLLERLERRIAPWV